MLAAALISGNLDTSVVDSYPELSPFLPQELTFFHLKFSGNKYRGRLLPLLQKHGSRSPHHVSSG